MPEGEEEEQGSENLFEKIMKENFPNLVKEIEILLQEAQRVPNKLDPKKPTPRHIINVCVYGGGGGVRGWRDWAKKK